VVAQDRACEPGLLRGIVGSATESLRVGDGAARGETDGAEGEHQRRSGAPRGQVVSDELGDVAPIVVTMAAAMSRFMGRAAVVTRA
jgi:hypothetical protein